MCPRCLLGHGLSVGSVEGDRVPGRVEPSLDEVKAMFPQLEILGLVGCGGMGVVYKARQPRLNRVVAVKVLPLAPGRHEEFSQRFLREARALASLNHPGIVTIYDFGEAGNTCYFIMEYIDGCDLREMIAERSLKLYDAMNIAVSICDALQYAHEHGVVHRDIKPANILVDRDGRIKIVDFGLARILHEAGTEFPLTLTNESMGTPYYMAPEQRDAARSTDERADLYSLGVVLYEMLTGELPLGHFGLPSEKCGAPQCLDRLVLKMLEADPTRRYRQAREIKAGIEAMVSAGPLARVQGRAPHARFVGLALTWMLVTAGVVGGLVFLAMLSGREAMPEDAVLFEKNYYRVFHENIGWYKAKARCERMGGHLAVVRNKGQDEFLASLSRSHVWLGATAESKKGTWTWVDGSSMTYSNWDSGEPSHSLDSATGERENFLMMSKYGKWNDFTANCRIIDGFVCEWDGRRFPVKNAAMTPDQVNAALKKANPRYNRKAVFTVKDGEIKELGLLDTGVEDLSPLKGLRLVSLNISWTEVSDLSPLENMPLFSMEMTRSQVGDLLPLAGMPLISLRIDGTKVRDLSPLKGMPLTYLDLSHTRVTDLEPLKGMPLRELHMNCAKVVDLSPLAGMPLRVIGMLDVPARDLSPLGTCTNLESAVVPVQVKSFDCLKNLPILKKLNNQRPADVWSEKGSK